jgi:hypothetical protein
MLALPLKLEATMSAKMLLRNASFALRFVQVRVLDSITRSHLAISYVSWICDVLTGAQRVV